MNRQLSLYRTMGWAVVVMVVALGYAGAALALDDDRPFTSSTVGLPNVMLIFDNSDSMQDVPALRKDGRPYRPSHLYWRRGVKIDDDGTIAENSSGYVVYDENAYSSEEEIPIPAYTTPPMPRIDGQPASLTSTVTKIERLSRWDRIYDENLDWSAIEAGWPENYRYQKVILQDPMGGPPQVRTIENYNPTYKYWRVYKFNSDPSYDIDYSSAVAQNDKCITKDNTSCSSYDPVGAPFTYTIQAGSPNEVTYPYLRTDEYNGRYIRTANVDWAVIDDATYKSTYRNKKLIITAGTGAGEERRITGYSQKYKYWYLDSPILPPPDYTTQYKIVGSPNDERTASGGNHPASKMYQAKLALTEFLKMLEQCEERDDQGNCIDAKYNMNMGFATYMQARYYRTYAKYYRYVESLNPQCRAYYYYDSTITIYPSDYTTGAQADGYSGPFTFDYGGSTYTMSIGDRKNITLDSGKCKEQTISFELKSASYNPEDNKWSLKLQGSGKKYTWRYFDVTDCSECATYAYPDVISSKYYLATDCQTDYAPGCIEGGGGYYDYIYYETPVSWSVTDPTQPRYLHSEYQYLDGYDGDPKRRWIVEPYKEITHSGDTYKLLTEVISGVQYKYYSDSTSKIRAGDLVPNIYDASYFISPGWSEVDSTNGEYLVKPHAWSYRKGTVKATWNSTTSDSAWPDDPTFPSTQGSEQGVLKGNVSGDDQVVFVDLPAYDKNDKYAGDDVYGQNIAKILNYVSLARVPSFRDTENNSTWYTNEDYTMMPYTESIAVNEKENKNWGKGTPLAASLHDVRLYYESYFRQDPLTQQGCRNNFVILLTDGLETCDGDPEAEAKALLDIGVQTFVIGFGLGEESRAELDKIAVAGRPEGSGAKAYLASNKDELLEILGGEIMESISGEGTFSRASMVITTLITAEDELNNFQAYFDYPGWRGHLLKNNLDEANNITGVSDDWVGDCNGDGQNDGDAGCVMQSAGRGRVFTSDGAGTEIDFDVANAATLAPMLQLDDTDPPAETVINYVLDPGYEGGKYAGTRDPSWLLGDIYHATPVHVPAPRFDTDESGYDTFKTTYESRPTMVYAAANDGMLHAFYSSDGTEAWAYIPKAVLPTLKDFRDGHRFTVDGSPAVADIDAGGWKTMLVGGLRAGGRYYYALDISDPANPNALWEVTYDGLGLTYSKPKFGMINQGNSRIPVIFVGGGYSDTPDRGNRVYILSAVDGSLIKEFVVGDSSNNIPSEILAVRFREPGGSPVDQWGEAVESSWSGNIEALYFADINGTLWKISNLNSKTKTGWAPTLEVLYIPDVPKPVFYRPEIAESTEYCTKRFVLYGTGDEENRNIATTNYFYEIEDRKFEGDEASLSDAEKSALRFKWKKELPNQLMLSNPIAYRGKVYFTTFSPDVGDGATAEEQCMGGMGTSYVWGLTVSDCENVGGEPGIEKGLDGVVLDEPVEYLEIGPGISVTTEDVPPPSLPIMQTGTAEKSDMTLGVGEDAARLIYWREVF